MTGNITSIRIVDGLGTKAGGRAIGTSDHQESQGVRESKGKKEKDDSELEQRIIATKPC